MKNLGVKIFLGLIAITLIIMPFSCKRIDAGHAGIKVNLYGDEKGVDDVTEVTGWVWFNFFTHQVFEVPTFVQTASYTLLDIEESEPNEEFNITTKDGINVQFDLSINYYTPDTSVVSIFKKYRKPVYELEKGVLRNFIKDAFNNIANDYTAEQLYEKRAQFENVSEVRLKKELGAEGFILDQAVILGKLRFPTNVEANIEHKVNATQVALKKQQEVQQAVYDAQKKVEKSRGDSASIMIRAQADAQAYKIKRVELNDLLVQQQFLTKWDGKLPVYGEVPQLFKTVTRK